jgi:esterase/lipase
MILILILTEAFMSTLSIILIIIGVLALGGLVSMLAYTYPISKKVYKTQLVRTEPQKWARVCSAPENEEQLEMWNKGIEWADLYRDKITEVKTQNDGFNLYGEYFDFGSDKCVIILPGRCESLIYSYYFAEPYRKAGFNVLVVDTRCHGKSDGIYNTIGVKESGDVIAWSKLLNEKFGIKEVWYHGICIGTASAIFAIIRKDCPDYVKGFVTEGCFVSFRETFKRHMMADNRPLFPVLDLVMLHINHHTKTNVYKDKPITAIKKVAPEKRVLFLYGKQDIFSIPQKSQLLFNACNATDKKLVWFEKGGHSHLRINNTESYDNAIIDFLKD